MWYHCCCGWGDIHPNNGSHSSLGRRFSSLLTVSWLQSLQSCLSSLLTEGLLPFFDQHSCIKVVQRNPSEEGYSYMKNKAEENVQVSHEIRTQMFKGIKLEPWHAAMMIWPIMGDVLCSLVKHRHSVLVNIQEDKTMIENWVEQGLGSSDYSLKSLWWHFPYLWFSECIIHLSKYSINLLFQTNFLSNLSSFLDLLEPLCSFHNNFFTRKFFFMLLCVPLCWGFQVVNCFDGIGI